MASPIAMACRYHPHLQTVSPLYTMPTSQLSTNGHSQITSLTALPSFQPRFIQLAVSNMNISGPRFWEVSRKICNSKLWYIVETHFGSANSIANSTWSMFIVATQTPWNSPHRKNNDQRFSGTAHKECNQLGGFYIGQA